MTIIIVAAFQNLNWDKKSALSSQHDISVRHYWVIEVSVPNELLIGLFSFIKIFTTVVKTRKVDPMLIIITYRRVVLHCKVICEFVFHPMKDLSSYLYSNYLKFALQLHNLGFICKSVFFRFKKKLWIKLTDDCMCLSLVVITQIFRIPFCKFTSFV